MLALAAARGAARMQHHDAKLATLDRGIASLIPDREQRARWVEAIE